MTTLKQTTSVDGTVISNNDPSMVITLDPTSGVRISSIQDDSITYSFTENVEQDVVLTPNLTFTYKGKYKTTIPLSLTHKHAELLVLTLSPEETTGGTGDIITLTPTVSYNNTPIPLDDPSLTFSVTPDSMLTIQEITATEIKVKVTSTDDTATDFVSQLIVKQGKETATKPWTHHYTVQKQYSITATKEDITLVPAASNTLYFNLKDNEGNPVTNATKVDMTVVDTPAHKFIIAGYGGELTNYSSVTPGQYSVSVNLGQSKGPFAVKLTVAVPDKTDGYVLTGLDYENPGSPAIATSSIPSINSEKDSATEVPFTLTQSKYLKPNDPAVGSVTVTSVTGAGVLGTQATAIQPDGTYTMSLKGTGVVGLVTVKGTYTPTHNGINLISTPFQFDVQAAEVIQKGLSITEGPTPTAVNGVTGDTLPVTIKLKYGEDILAPNADGVTYTVLPNAGAEPPIVDVIPSADGIGIKLNKTVTVESEKHEIEIQVNYDDKSIKFPLSVEIATDKKRPVFDAPVVNVKVGDKGARPFTLTSSSTGKPINDFSNLVITGNQYIKIVGTGWEIVDGSTQQETETSVNYSFSVIDDNVTWMFNEDVGFLIAAWDDALTVTSDAGQLIGTSGDEGFYPATLTWKGNPLPTETPGINGSVRPGGSGVLSMMGSNSEGLGYMLNGMIHPGVDVETQDVVVVMYFDDTGEGGNADLTIPILYKSPPITVTGIPPQDVKLNDVVVFDPEITCGDWPLTEDWTTVELTAPNDYIAVEGKGFKVIKDEAESLNRSIEFKFSGKFDSGRGEPVDWFVIKTINITIAAQ